MVDKERCLKCYWRTEENEGDLCDLRMKTIESLDIEECFLFNDKTISLDTYLKRQEALGLQRFCIDEDYPYYTWREWLRDMKEKYKSKKQKTS